MEYFNLIPLSQQFTTNHIHDSNHTMEYFNIIPLSQQFTTNYHGDQFKWWKKPEYPERTTNHGQANGKLYHLRLGVECTIFCNLQSWAQTHAVLVKCR
jgi:hypothetical protein